MLIGPANSTRLPLELEPGAVLRGEMPDTGGELGSWLEQKGAIWLARNLFRCRPRPPGRTGRWRRVPMSIRVFLARTPDGWRLMPGGFARLAANSQDPSAVSIRRGGSVADVWVVSDQAGVRRIRC
jgi:uncharacterized circularly permuted ATP-grasp superfamily protein